MLEKLLESPKTRRLAATLIAAFIVKALLLFVAIPATSEIFAGRYAIGFADDYGTLANNIATGIGYRFDPNMGETIMREPGYPLFLAGVFKVLGYRIEAARLANLLLALGIVLMLVRVAERLSDDPDVPAIAALLFLLHPGTLIAEARGGVEMLFILTLMIFLLALLRAVENGERRDYFMAGAALGFVVLIRSTPLLFPAFVLGYLILRGRSLQERVRAVRNTVILVVATAVVMSPWAMRNYALVHEFVPTASARAVAAQEGQYTCEHLSFAKGFQASQREAAAARNLVAGTLGVPFRGGYYQYFYTTKDEVEFNRVLQKNVLDRYRQNPTLIVECIAKNLVNFWVLGKTWSVTMVNVVIQLPLVVLSAIGAWLLWKRGFADKVAFIILLIVYVVAVHSIFIAHARHSIPLVPFLGVLASIALVEGWRGNVSKRKDSERPMGAPKDLG